MKLLSRFAFLSLFFSQIALANTCDMNRFAHASFPLPPLDPAIEMVELNNQFLKTCAPQDLSNYLKAHPAISAAFVKGSMFDLNNTKATVEALNQVSTIKYLVLSLPQVGNPMTALLPNTHFTYVGIVNSHLTDAAIAPLAKMPALKWLLLDSNDITDAGVKQLAAMPGLTVLGLSDTKITDNSRADWAKMNLSYLDISYTAVTDLTAKALAAPSSIRDLTVDGTQIQDEGVAALAKNTQLTSLSVGSLGFAKNHQIAGLQALAANTTLTNLSVSYAELTDSDLQLLASNQHIQHLDLSGNAFTDAGLLAVLTIPSLTGLSLESVPTLAVSTYQALANKPNLTTLNMWNAGYPYGQVSDASIAALATGHFTHLALSSCGLTDTQVATLTASLKKLEYLDVTNNQLTDASAMYLSNDVSISMLDISENHFTARGIDALRRAGHIQYLMADGQTPLNKE